MVLLSYIVKSDYGFAPNPYWGTLTLTTCKWPIRLEGQKLKELHKDGFWIIGTGSKEVVRSDGSTKDYSGKLVFAMKVSQVMSLKEYDRFCSQLNSPLKNKIPDKVKDLRIQAGDCIYKYPIIGENPLQRPGLHCSNDIQDDLKGDYSLLSTEFYYFGCNAITIPNTFDSLILNRKGYKKIEDQILITEFVDWLKSLDYDKSNIPKPQLFHLVPKKFNTKQ
jgi:hypothetical protein